MIEANVKVFIYIFIFFFDNLQQSETVSNLRDNKLFLIFRWFHLFIIYP